LLGDLDPTNPLKRLRFVCFRWFPWEHVLEVWLSIPLDWVGFGDRASSQRYPTRYPNYPQSLTLIRGTNWEIDCLEYWVFQIPVSPTCVRLSPTEAVWRVLETGLTSLRCQQPCRVCFRCVCRVVVGWVLLLGPVALQWLRGLGKRSLWRCTSEIGFIGRILELNFYRLPFSPPPLWFAASVLH
jgi:hypothetical protein